MRRRLATIAATSMVAITLLTPSLASAGQPGGLPEDVIYDEQTRSAVAIIHREEGCLMTEIWISASEDQRIVNDGTSGSFDRTDLNVYQRDICQDVVVLDVELDNMLGHTLSEHLSSATVSGQALATSDDGDTVPVSADIQWTPAGPRVFHQFTDEFTVHDPITGEEVLVLQEETQIEHQAKVRGTITVGDQTLQINERSADTFFVGFDLTWTMLAQ